MKRNKTKRAKRQSSVAQTISTDSLTIETDAQTRELINHKNIKKKKKINKSNNKDGSERKNKYVFERAEKNPTYEVQAKIEKSNCRIRKG